MNRANLIPQQRRQARARKARTRSWIVINLSWALGLGAVGVGISLAAAAIRYPASELAKTQQELESTNKQLSNVRSSITREQQLLASSKAVSNQPDWSVLLAKVAQSIGDDVVLERCELASAKEEPVETAVGMQPVNLAAKPANSPGGSRIQVHIAGIGKSQAAVTQFVLRLEQMKLFERVHLLQTTRMEFGGAEAVGFDLDCPLQGRMGGTP